MPVLEVERGFHENAALHINSLTLVFGRCQEKLPESHVAWIEIDRAKSWRSVFLGDGEFDIVCPELDIDNRFSIDEIFVTEKCPYGGVANFFFIVIGERKWEWFQVEVFFAKSRPK